MKSARWEVAAVLAGAAAAAAALAGTTALAAPATLGSEVGPPSPPPLVLTLEEAVRRAVVASGEVGAASVGIRAAEARLAQARGGSYPRLEATFTAGPWPPAPGDQVFSPDDVDRPAVTGVFGRADVRLIQPLYTFGRLTAGRAAAAAGVEAAQADVVAKATETSQRTIQAYLGLLLARDSLGFVEEIEEEIDKELTRVRERAAGPEDLDLLRLETFAAEVERGRIEAEAGVAVAAAGLALLVGAPPGVTVEPAENSLTDGAPPSAGLPPLDAYLAGLEARRPEFAQLRAGLAAREAQARLAAAERRPSLFLLGIADLAGATNRDSLDNPFVTDPLRHRQIGMLLGLRWEFDFGAAGKVRAAREEAARLAAQQAAARGGLPFEVRRTYIDLRRALGAAAAMERAVRTARRWLTAASTAADLGVAEPAAVSTAFGAYAKNRADYFLALYNARLAEANLRHAAGLDAEALAPLVLGGAR
jgi:outer membrane protein TolC